VFFLAGAVFTARLLPPWISAHDDAHRVAMVYIEHTDRIRVGLVLTIIAMALLGPWGVSIAAQLRRREGAFPSLTYVQLTSMGAGVALVMAACVVWMGAAFRPASVNPEITQTLHAIGWFFFLCTWPTFTVWACAVGAAILLDPVAGAVYPRWAGFLNVWLGVLFSTSALIIFFKQGAWSWNGVLGLWVPAAALVTWLAVMSILTLRSIQRGLIHDPASALA
jgi:hypothetical protein